MRTEIVHAPRCTGRADSAIFTTIGDEQLVFAVLTFYAGETVSEDAALEIALEFALDKAWQALAIRMPIACPREEPLEILLNEPVKQGFLRPVAFVLAPERRTKGAWITL